MNKKEIEVFFQKYRKNLYRKEELDERLFQTEDKQYWFAALQQRSYAQREMFSENEALIQRVLIPFVTGKEPVNEENADTIYACVLEMYYAAQDDYYILLTFLNPLIAYYEAKEEKEKLLELYACRNFEMTEIRAHLFPDEAILLEGGDLFRILRMRSCYIHISEPRKRLKIINAYYNLIIAGVANAWITVNESCHYYKEFQKFWQTKEVQQLDGKRPEFQNMAGRIKVEWLGTELCIDEADEEAKQLFIRIENECFLNEQAKGKSRAEMPYDIVAAHLHVQVWKKELNWETAITCLFHYYQEHREYMKKTAKENRGGRWEETVGDTEYLFYWNVPSTMHQWAIKYQIPKERYESYMRVFVEDINKMWFTLYKHLAPTYLDNHLMEWCFQMLPFIDSKEEQEQWLTQLIVKRHTATCIHTLMVAQLAKTLITYILTDAPHLFRGFADLSDTEIQVYKNEIIEYIEKGAMFHDIGKSRITEVVNIQTRRLSQDEFRSIRLHPVIGADYVKGLPNFERYRDIILGHHKFYNGKGGYPQSFDHRQSKVRLAIELITICDCLDSATDIMNRNYASGKTFSVVFEELQRDAGVRYNPDFVQFIGNHAILRSKLEYLTGEGRMEVCYQVYDEYVANICKEEEHT